MARTPLVAGNWKMHGTLGEVRELTDGILDGLADSPAAEVAVFPPFVYLAEVASRGGNRLALGAQNLSEHDQGAYTGEVSGAMLADFDCRYVLVGHSERRSIYGETDEQAAAKFEAARRHDLVPVLCVGETLEEREAGETETVVGRQIDAVLKVAGAEAFNHAVVAYEPVWAIGTGRTATPDQAQETHAFIRDKLRQADDTMAGQMRILYGGSVKSANAADLFAMPDIDGGLVGGASLKAAEFIAIVRGADPRR